MYYHTPTIDFQSSTEWLCVSGLWYNSQYLREAKVNLLAKRVCQGKEYYGNLITDNMFCAGVPDWSRDACKVCQVVILFKHCGVPHSFTPLTDMDLSSLGRLGGAFGV